MIHAENIESRFVAQRPFRINAGAVSLYTFVPPFSDGHYQTKYLCELTAGDGVIVVDFKGNTIEAVVVRNKIENRPMTMIKALHPTLRNPYKEDSLDFIHTFVQNAETTNLVSETGEPMPLAKLKPGDKIMAYTKNPHEVSRHFGTLVNGIKILENPYFGRS